MMLFGHMRGVPGEGSSFVDVVDRGRRPGLGAVEGGEEGRVGGHCAATTGVEGQSLASPGGSVPDKQRAHVVNLPGRRY